MFGVVSFLVHSSPVSSRSTEIQIYQKECREVYKSNPSFSFSKSRFILTLHVKHALPNQTLLGQIRPDSRRLSHP